MTDVFSCFAAWAGCIVTKDPYLGPTLSQGKGQPLSLNTGNINIVIITHEQSSCLMIRLMSSSWHQLAVDPTSAVEQLRQRLPVCRHLSRTYASEF